MHLLLAAVVGATLFPLAPGHRWTLRDVDSGAMAVVSVRKGHVLRGLPEAGDLRVRRSGQTVQVWDTGQRRWEDLFRFGAKAGTRYTVSLRAVELWRAVEIRVASKTAAVSDYHGKVRRGCTRFAFEFGGVADTGLTDMAFCPRVGPVRFSESTIAGPRTFALARAGS